MNNRNKGFSLVEVIVVAVIVAVLAAVGIPMYRGYINSQRQSTVSNLAETAAAAANANWRRTSAVIANSDLYPNNTLGLYYNNSSYSITVAGNVITVKDLSSSTITSTATYN